MGNNIYYTMVCEDISAKLSNNIASRYRSEKPMINWWLWMLLSFITFGIAGLVVFILRIMRVDRYIRRKREYYQLVAEYTRKRLERSAGGIPDSDMRELLNFSTGFTERVHTIGVIFTLFMTTITLGLFILFYIYRMNRVWFDAQNEEIKFNVLLSNVWQQAHLIDKPLPFTCVDKLKRSYLLYMILGFVSFGLWFIVWDYITHVTPEKMFVSVHTTEDIICRTMFGEPC